MKHIDKYQIFEAKEKKNWLEITQNKLKEFKQMVDNNPVMQDWNNDDVMSELVTSLKDITGSKFDVWYEEYVKFVCDKDYLSTQLTKNGEIRKDFSTFSPFGDIQNPYRSYITITNWLDKKRASGKEIDAYYIVDFEINFNRNLTEKEYKDFIKSNKFTEYKEEIENTKEFLKSLGFEIQGGSNLDRLRAIIKLQKTEEIKKKTLDLSDIVSPNIADEFEKFILKRGLTRSDAEEIAAIFNKK
jgi:hypothetical protein